MVTPLQYAAPMSAPTLVPATKPMAMFSSSRTLRTPICAMPRAKPPPRASPMLAELLSCCCPARPDKPRPKGCTERMIWPRLFTGTSFLPAAAPVHHTVLSNTLRLTWMLLLGSSPAMTFSRTTIRRSFQVSRSRLGELRWARRPYSSRRHPRSLCLASLRPSQPDPQCARLFREMATPSGNDPTGIVATTVFVGIDHRDGVAVFIGHVVKSPSGVMATLAGNESPPVIVPTTVFFLVSITDTV